MSECLVCDEVSGEVAVPGDHLQSDADVLVFHAPVVAPATDVPAGFLLVVSRRHVPGFAGLTSGEAAAVGVAIARWSRALEAIGATHVYVQRVGHGCAHLHVLLLPRWPETPPDISWTDVGNHTARRGDDAFAATVAVELRECDAQLPAL